MSAPATKPLPSLNTPSCPLSCGSPTSRLRENSRAPPDTSAWQRNRKSRQDVRGAGLVNGDATKRSQQLGRGGVASPRVIEGAAQGGLASASRGPGCWRSPPATTPEPSTNVPTRASSSAGHCKRIRSPAFSWIRPGAHTRLAAKQLQYERLGDRVSGVPVRRLAVSSRLDASSCNRGWVLAAISPWPATTIFGVDALELPPTGRLLTTSRRYVVPSAACEDGSVMLHIGAVCRPTCHYVACFRG